MKVSKDIKKTSITEFILVKHQPYSVYIATLLQADFTRDYFWNMFRKLAVLKMYISRKKVYIASFY